MPYSHMVEMTAHSALAASDHTLKRFQAEDATVLIPNGVGLRKF
jgi:hypothetical protein